VSNVFLHVNEPDELKPDQPDPEEPSTWQHAADRSDADVDALDWADQQSMVDDSLFDEDAPESGNTIVNGSED